jgi:hypothetical protein
LGNKTIDLAIKQQYNIIMAKSLDKRRYEVITQEAENGDLIIPLPPPLLEALKLKEGDDVEIDVDEKGRLILKKANK